MFAIFREKQTGRFFRGGGRGYHEDDELLSNIKNISIVC